MEITRKKPGAYLYPNTKLRINKMLYNPYIDDLIDAFGKYFNFLNSADKTDKGILNMISYYGRTDYIFLNWIEDLPVKRLRKLLSFIFIILLFTGKFL